MYDAAASILEQKLSQIEGVGQVIVGGSSLPAVRVELNPTQLNNYGIGLDDVRRLAAANANRPKGDSPIGTRPGSISTTDQLLKAEEYRPLIVAISNGARCGWRMSPGARTPSRTAHRGHGRRQAAVLLIIFRQPGANIIDTVDRVTRRCPQLRASIPPAIEMNVVLDRTTTIRASVHDVELTLMISIVLVILVVFVFLRNLRATLIPSVAVPVSLIGTFGVMYLLGYSLDNLSLMALTISTGFVVDDAIVVIENITRYLEQGMSPLEAALRAPPEIGFTVLSISISLIAVFIPILLMGGIVGRLFREFAVTLVGRDRGLDGRFADHDADDVRASAQAARPGEARPAGTMASERVFDWILDGYERSLLLGARSSAADAGGHAGDARAQHLSVHHRAQGILPAAGHGPPDGRDQADQDMSFQAMKRAADCSSSATIEQGSGGRATSSPSPAATARPTPRHVHRAQAA